MYAKYLVISMIAVLGFAKISASTETTLSLIDIITKVEKEYKPRYIDEISWDKHGYWEFEIIDEYGLKIDPVSGIVRDRSLY